MSSLLLLYYSRGRKGTNFPGILITGPPCSFSKDEDSSPLVSVTHLPLCFGLRKCAKSLQITKIDFSVCKE